MSSLTISPIDAKIFGAFNCHMKVIFLNYDTELQINQAEMVQFLDRRLPDIKVFSKSFHIRPINQKIRHKQKQSPIHPKGANKPKIFRGCDLMHFGGNVSRKMTSYLR